MELNTASISIFSRFSILAIINTNIIPHLLNDQIKKNSSQYSKFNTKDLKQSKRGQNNHILCRSDFRFHFNQPLKHQIQTNHNEQTTKEKVGNVTQYIEGYKYHNH
mmetsp:Transcript_28555/g.60022  ORF Transcript_28555/g.60022 Transcript_28555/m.60022 type:complete len:106 (+) Transcript_28555:236-553(+)